MTNKTLAGRRGAFSCSFLLWLTLSLGNAQAATPVSGTIAGQTWTTANSPYVVTGDITVGTLTIQPGVTVQFAGNFVFSVGNRLTAVGTQDAPIVFVPQNETVGWKGISFDFAGSASEMAFCQVRGANQGGIRIHSSQPKIRDCGIWNNAASGNSAAAGAGVWTDTALTLTRCNISSNFLQSAVNAFGAGIYASATAPLTLDNCILLNNRISAGATGSNPTGAGGGVYAGNDITLRNCIIGGNQIAASGPFSSLGVAAGGGVFSAGTLSATNTAVGYNTINGTQSSLGAGVVTFGGQFVNSLICFNRASGISPSGGGIYADATAQDNVTIINCILWQDSPSELFGRFSVSYSDVMGGYAGTGNIQLNPLLTTGGFTIIEGSPCIDAGNPASIYNDVCFPLSYGAARNDMGAGGGPGACAFDNNPAGSAPVITAQPQSRAECLGQTATFSVTATGLPFLSYQWHFNQTMMPGQTNSTLNLTNLQSSMAGSYTVAVSNSAGNVTSRVAQLTINDACVDIKMYAGLTVLGLSGATYVISYTTDVAAPQAWTPLATNTLTGGPWFFIDRDSPASEKRFYRALRKL